MTMIVISASGVSLAVLVCARYLWLWATRDRRFEAAHAEFKDQFEKAARRRALTTETGLMPVISKAPARGEAPLDTCAARGVVPTASTTKPIGGNGGNAVVATDKAPSGAVTNGGVPAGEPIHRAAVVGVSGRSRYVTTVPVPVLRAGGALHKWQTASPQPPPPAAMRTPRSA